MENIKKEEVVAETTPKTDEQIKKEFNDKYISVVV